MDFLELCEPQDNVNDDNMEIYRYYSYCKLKKLFEDKSIYFCNAENFTDKRERQIPQAYYNMIEAKTSTGQKDMKKRIYDSKKNHIKSYITCWTTEQDNYAFWKIYTPDADGIMIKTTVGKLKRKFDPKNIVIAPVEYVKIKDKSKGIAHISFNNNEPESISFSEKYKIYPYNYEKEIRFILYSNDIEKGYDYKIGDLDFIDEFMISPFANNSMSNVISDLITKYVPNAIINTSEIKESE